MQDARHIEPCEHAGNLVRRDDMGRDEPPQRAAEPVLLARDDGGVRDRQAERVAEQRGDREPVGDAADEPGLGGGFQQAAPHPGGRA